MKKLVSMIIVFLVVLGASAGVEARSYRTKPSDNYVGGYYKKNGTYVAPYYRSKRDNSKSNNYSCIDYGKCK